MAYPVVVSVDRVSQAREVWQNESGERPLPGRAAGHASGETDTGPPKSLPRITSPSQKTNFAPISFAAILWVRGTLGVRTVRIRKLFFSHPARDADGFRRRPSHAIFGVAETGVFRNANARRGFAQSGRSGNGRSSLARCLAFPNYVGGGLVLGTRADLEYLNHPFGPFCLQIGDR